MWSQKLDRGCGAGTLAEKSGAGKYGSNTLKSLFALAEAYPDLKANQKLLELQTRLLRY